MNVIRTLLMLFVAVNGFAQTNFLPGNKQCHETRSKTSFTPEQRKISGQNYCVQTNDVIYYQDFENFIPGDMIFIDHDGLIPMDTSMFGATSNWIVWEMEPGNHVAASTSYLTNGDYTADDWMITPPIMIDPTLTNPVYLVWDAMAFSPIYADGYQVLISTTDTALDHFTPIFQIAAENGLNWTTRTLNLTELGYSGQIYIAFRNNSCFMWNLYIDNITVTEVNAYPDAAMASLSSATFAAFGQEIHVAATLKNYSSGNLTSAGISWTLNGFGPYTENLTGMNIPYLSDTVFSITIPKQMAATTIQLTGTNALKVWVSDPNNMQDTVNNNDTLSAAFDLSTNYYYYMDFEHYVEGDMTLIDNDTLTPIEGWNDWRIVNWSGDNNYAASISYDAGGQVDQWMITPPVEVGNDAFVFWEGKAIYDGDDEVLEVLVSATGDSIQDFTALNTYHETTTVWTLRSCDLTAYTGQIIHLAFRGRSNNQTELGVDNIQIKPFVGIDLALTNITIPRYLETNTYISVKGSIKNTSATTVTSFKMNY
ncbi:MAG: choice-of-anchor J domain-containing protein [Bacteroidetes bacterium]|nr:choice-of-anchor J domain-containing protein [Bacteroidota bacterium]